MRRRFISSRTSIGSTEMPATTSASANPIGVVRSSRRLANTANIVECMSRADLVVGAIYVHGRRPERLLLRELVRRMQCGAALVDVSIDQGAIAETSRPTTHADPFYVAEGVVHYCVTNMPAAVARTATTALTDATLPYVLALAERGVTEALRADPGLAAGLNVAAGKVMHAGLAADLGETAGRA